MRGVPAHLLVLSFAVTPACASSAPAAPPAHIAESLPAAPAPSGTISPPPPVAPPTASPASPASPASAPPSPDSPRHHPGPRDPAEEAAMRVTAAWTVCDMPGAIALSLSYEEVVALTSKPVDRVEWNKNTRDFVDERCREFAQFHGQIITAKIVKTEHHDPTEAPELKVALDITFVQLVVEENGVASLRGMLMPFIRVGDGFKFVSKP